LVGEDIAVGKEEDARAPDGFAAETPAAVEELPRDLESDEGFASARSKREQDALSSGGDCGEDALDGDVLVAARLEVAAFGFERDGREAVAPGVGFREGWFQNSPGVG